MTVFRSSMPPSSLPVIDENGRMDLTWYHWFRDFANVENYSPPVPLSEGGTNANLTANSGGIFYSTASAGAILSGTVTANKALYSGSSLAPSWSAYSYPAAVGSSGQVLSSDGTNLTFSTLAVTASAGAAGSILRSDGAAWVASTSLWPNTVGSTNALVLSNGTTNTYSAVTYPNAVVTAGKLIISDGLNYIASTSIWPNTVGTSGKVVISDGTSNVYSTPTFPNASATAGKFIRSDGTNWIASTPTLPTTAGAAGKILASDATNYVESTPTFPYSASATAGKNIQSDGTNWVASTSTWPTTGTQGGMVYCDAANSYTQLAKDTTATRYVANTGASNSPAWAQVALATGVSGTLPVANGGTGITALPNFSAYCSASQSVATATYTKVNFNSENNDLTGAYDTTNKRWLPLKAGLYSISATVQWTLTAAAYNVHLIIYINGSLWHDYYQKITWAAQPWSQCLTSIVDLNGSTDYVEVFVYQDSGANRTLNSDLNAPNFSGFWVGPSS